MPVKIRGRGHCALKLQLIDAQRTLLSASKVCDGRHEVVFRSDGGFIRHVETKRKIGEFQSKWSLQDGSRSRRRCDSGFQLARATSGTCGSSVRPNHQLEEEAEKLAPVEEGAQEEGAGSELFGESQDDENDVEVDGEMVFEEDLEEALLPAVVPDPGALHGERDR